MASAVKFSRTIGVSLAKISSHLLPLSRTLARSNGHSNLLNRIKSFEHILENRGARIQWKSSLQTIYASPGNMLKMGSILGASVVIGSVSCRPTVAYAMDGLDVLVDNHVNALGTSAPNDDPRVIWAIVKKLWLPIVFFVTVLVNWDHPMVLVAKAIFILLGTKPNPHSVYLFIEQMRHQAMLQNPFLYKFRPLLATKVDVEDYLVLCLAKVELRGQKYTLIGVLGSWWMLPLSSFQEAISALTSSLNGRALKSC